MATVNVTHVLIDQKGLCRVVRALRRARAGRRSPIAVACCTRRGDDGLERIPILSLPRSRNRPILSVINLIGRWIFSLPRANIERYISFVSGSFRRPLRDGQSPGIEVDLLSGRTGKELATYRLLDEPLIFFRVLLDYSSASLLSVRPLSYIGWC